MAKLSVVLAVIGLAFLLLSALPAQPALSTTLAPTSLPAAAPNASAAQVAYGKALFSAKGCVTCHHHAAVPGSGAFGEGNPDLTSYRWTAEYLHTWLKDPAALKPNATMPNLDLKLDEIEALIAFLSASK
jgi:cytochrome c2